MGIGSFHPSYGTAIGSSSPQGGQSASVPAIAEKQEGWARRFAPLPTLQNDSRIYSMQLPFLSMPSFTASAAAKVGTGLLTVL